MSKTTSTKTTNTTKISPFDITDICVSASWIILGPPGSGKSSFVEDLCKFNRDKYPVCRVICSAPGPYQRYCQVFPPLFVHSKFDIKEEKNFVQRQIKLAMKKDANGNPHPGSFCVYILDDINSDKRTYKDGYIARLFMQGSRHWNSMTIMVNQYALEFPPNVRSSASYIVIFRYSSEDDRVKLYKNYASNLFPEYKLFNEAIDSLTGDHCCMVIKQYLHSNILSESLFWYKTTPQTSNWKFGSQSAWDWNNARCSAKKKTLFEF